MFFAFPVFSLALAAACVREQKPVFGLLAALMMVPWAFYAGWPWLAVILLFFMTALYKRQHLAWTLFWAAVLFSVVVLWLHLIVYQWQHPSLG